MCAVSFKEGGASKCEWGKITLGLPRTKSGLRRGSCS